MIRVLELFAGTRSVSKAFERIAIERERERIQCFTVEWDTRFKGITVYEDVAKLTKERIIEICGGIPDVIWASPDCTTYSVAAISHHRRKNGNTLEPISDYAKQCDETNRHVIQLIKELRPKYWFIENPRGGLRKMDFMAGLPRYTVTYCQYGDYRMKPTDIWTNHPNPRFKPACHYGDSCHIAAPRGSKTGTQGIKGHIDRSRLPDALADHIAQICMEGLDG